MKKTLTTIVGVGALAATLTGCSSSGSSSPYLSAGFTIGAPTEHRGVLFKDVDPEAAGIFDEERTGVYQHGINTGHTSRTQPEYDPLRVQRD